MNDPYINAAKDISDYLMLGWHHGTPQGCLDIASILKEHFKPSNPYLDAAFEQDVATD